MEMYPNDLELYDFQDSDQIFSVEALFPFRQSSFIQSEKDYMNHEIQQPIQFLENDSTFKIIDQKKSQRNDKAPKPSLETKKIKKIKPQKRDYKKNICRNLLRHAIKSMINCNLCSSYLEELVDDVQYFKQYYNKILESITGFRVLREQLIYTNDKEIDQNRKRAFKQYLIWYLQTRATQIILQGETKYPTEYIKYKNEVLLYYVQEPEKWNSNNPEWKGGTCEQRCIFTDESNAKTIYKTVEKMNFFLSIFIFFLFFNVIFFIPKICQIQIQKPSLVRRIEKFQNSLFIAQRYLTIKEQNLGDNIENNLIYQRWSRRIKSNARVNSQLAVIYKMISQEISKMQQILIKQQDKIQEDNLIIRTMASREEKLQQKSKYQLRRKIVKKQKLVDNILSFKNYIPVLKNKPDEGQELIPQQKLDQIFIAAQQSLSEDESSSSGSYVMVKESQLIRLKRAFFNERVRDGMLKEKIRKLKEDFYKKLEQCQNKQQNMDNGQGFNSNQQDNNQEQSSDFPRNVNSIIDQGSNYQLLFGDAQEDKNIEKFDNQKDSLNILQQQIRKTIQNPKKKKNIKQIKKWKKQHSIQSNQSEFQNYQSGSKRQKKGGKQFENYDNNNQCQSKYDSQIEEYRGNYLVQVTEYGNKYHKYTCRVLQGNVVQEELTIDIAQKQYRPCGICFQ